MPPSLGNEERLALLQNHVVPREILQLGELIHNARVGEVQLRGVAKVRVGERVEGAEGGRIGGMEENDLLPTVDLSHIIMCVFISK